MVSNEEAWHTVERENYYVIKPMLPELLKKEMAEKVLAKEYSSGDWVMTLDETRQILKQHSLMVGQEIREEGEFLK